MRAAAIDRFGGIETLTLQTLPVPKVGPDEVLIRIEAAGLGSCRHAARARERDGAQKAWRKRGTYVGDAAAATQSTAASASTARAIHTTSARATDMTRPA